MRGMQNRKGEAERIVVRHGRILKKGEGVAKSKGKCRNLKIMYRIVENKRTTIY